MTKLMRRRVVAAKTESTLGTWASPGAADAKFSVIDPKVNFNPATFERNISQASLTKHQNVTAGVSPVEVTFGVELAGHPDNAASADFVSPKFAPCLLACGMKEVECWAGNIAGRTITSGPFQHGETVTQATSGATGVVVSDTFNGDSLLIMESVTGTFDATNTITGGTSAASMTGGLVSTLTSSDQSRRGWYFDSDPDTVNAVSLNVYRDGKIVSVKGARGTCSIPFVFGDRAVMQFTFQGVLHAKADGALITPAVEQSIPPQWINIDMAFSDGTLDAVDATDFQISTATLDLGNSVVIRENAQNASGYSFAIIDDRSPTLSVNPDQLDNSDFDFADAYIEGTAIHGDFTLGSTSGNIFHFKWPAAIFNALSDSDRDGVDIVDGTLDLSGGEYPTGGSGQEQELVIFNL